MLNPILLFKIIVSILFDKCSSVYKHCYLAWLLFGPDWWFNQDWDNTQAWLVTDVENIPLTNKIIVAYIQNLGMGFMRCLFYKHVNYYTQTASVKIQSENITRAFDFNSWTITDSDGKQYPVLFDSLRINTLLSEDKSNLDELEMSSDQSLSESDTSQFDQSDDNQSDQIDSNQSDQPDQSDQSDDNQSDQPDQSGQSDRSNQSDQT